MGELIEFEKYLPRLDFELPYINSEDLPVINKIRSKFENIEGFDFLYVYVGLVKKGRNILTTDDIENNTIHENLEFHISKLSNSEAEVLTKEINSLIKDITKVSLKKQLLFLRNKVIQKNSDYN